MQPFWQVVVATVFGLVAAVLFVWFARYSFYDGEWPTYAQVCVFSSPIVPFAVAAIASICHVQNDQISGNGRIVSCVCGGVVTFICLALCHPDTFSRFVFDYTSYSIHGWRAHIVLLMLLYLFFIVWDGIFSVCTMVPEYIRIESRRTLLFLNIPTFFALLVLFGYLNQWSQNASKDAIWLDVKTYGYESIFEVFVSGIIAFHLTVGAIIFLLMFFGARIFHVVGSGLGALGALVGRVWKVFLDWFSCARERLKGK